MLNQPVSLAPFQLTNHRSEPFSNQQLSGKWTVLFFGYTHCSDVCPTTLAVLNQAYKALLESGSDPNTLQFVFVSVDPHRDDVERIGEHVTFFNPNFIGATGDVKSLYKFSWNLGARFDYRDKDTKKVIKDVSTKPRNADYTVGHMSDLFLIAPDGNLVGYIFPPPDVERTLSAFTLIRDHVDKTSTERP